MDSINWVISQLPIWGTAALTVVGAVTVILSTLGATLPEAWSFTRWCRTAAADVSAFTTWVRQLIAGGPPPAGPTALLVLCALCLPLTACAGSFEAARVAGQKERASLAVVGVPVVASATPQRCQLLDEEHQTWTSIAKAGAVLTGAGGIATIPADDQGVRIGIAVGTVVIGAVTAFAAAESDGAAAAWARECSTP